MEIISDKITYRYKPEEIKKLIAEHLKVDVKKVEIIFNIEEVGGDSLDRYPGTDTVTSISLIVSK